MPEDLAPGVFVQETSFRSRSIEGVSTSVTAFVGPTLTGPTNRASDALTSMESFEHEYGVGTDLVFADGSRILNFMWHAARAFFANGGQRLHVARARRAGDVPPEASDYASAFEQLDLIPEIAIVAAPGSTFEAHPVQRPDARARVHAKVQALLAYVGATECRIAIVDSGVGQSPSEVLEMRANFDSAYGALYYPWVKVIDPAGGGHIRLPPSGFVAGICTRVDRQRGVHRTPANEALSLAVGLERDLTREEQEELHLLGVNLLRPAPGRGIVVWGARTLSPSLEWKYVNIRRLLIFLERSINRGTQWAVFEPNGEALWSNIRRTVEDFLLAQWRVGALMGAVPDAAFFVRCDRTTMTQDDIDNGRLICLVGVAPVRPGEFITFRVGQWTADRKG